MFKMNCLVKGSSITVVDSGRRSNLVVGGMVGFDGVEEKALCPYYCKGV